MPGVKIVLRDNDPIVLNVDDTEVRDEAVEAIANAIVDETTKIISFNYLDVSVVIRVSDIVYATSFV